MQCTGSVGFTNSTSRPTTTTKAKCFKECILFLRYSRTNQNQMSGLLRANLIKVWGIRGLIIPHVLTLVQIKQINKKRINLVLAKFCALSGNSLQNWKRKK